MDRSLRKGNSLNLALFPPKFRGVKCTVAPNRFVLMLLLARLLIASVFFALASSHGYAQSEVGSGQVKAIFGAWKLKCAQIAGAKEDKCALVQDLKLEDRPNMFLTVLLMKSFDSNKKILRVVAPLGVVLPTGLGLRVDNADVGNVKFLKCWKFGCLAEVVVDDNLVSKFTSGKTASFIVYPTPDFGVGFPAPLAGFADGLKGLN
jgi:invasion protein IalB